MATKEQFMVSVDELMRDEVDALRIVLGVSRAEVVRRALTQGGVIALKRANVDRLGRLYNLAEAEGFLSWGEYVQALIKASPKLSPSLESLEGLARLKSPNRVKAPRRRKTVGLAAAAIDALEGETGEHAPQPPEAA